MRRKAETHKEEAYSSLLLQVSKTILVFLLKTISDVFQVRNCLYEGQRGKKSRIAGLDIIFQRLPDILSGRSTIWLDLSNRNSNIIFILFALCVGRLTEMHVWKSSMQYYPLRKVNFQLIEYFQIKLFCKISLILENATDKMFSRSKIWQDNWHFRPDNVRCPAVISTPAVLGRAIIRTV